MARMQKPFTFFTLFLLAGLVRARCPQGNGWQHVSGKCMACGNSERNLNDARTDCQDRGGFLTSILTVKEQEFAESCNTNIHNGVWIGLLAQISGGLPIFSWEDGSLYSPVDGVTMPAVAPSSQLCFYIGWSNTWWQEHFQCSNLRSYACSRREITCPALTAPRSATVKYNSINSTHIYPGDVAMYNCSSGHKMSVVVQNRTCQTDGTWDARDPECTPVDCGPLAAPVNGGLTMPSTTYNSVAAYSCNPGYTLGSVSPSRICQANGFWSGSNLNCAVVDCREPPTPANGQMEILTNTTTYSSEATYSCDEGYDISNGSPTRQCQGDGSWSGSSITCKASEPLNIAAIAGGVAGAAALIIGLFVASLIWKRKRSKPRQKGHKKKRKRSRDIRMSDSHAEDFAQGHGHTASPSHELPPRRKLNSVCNRCSRPGHLSSECPFAHADQPLGNNRSHGHHKSPGNHTPDIKAQSWNNVPSGEHHFDNKEGHVTPITSVNKTQGNEGHERRYEMDPTRDFGQRRDPKKPHGRKHHRSPMGKESSDLGSSIASTGDQASSMGNSTKYMEVYHEIASQKPYTKLGRN